MLRRRVAAMLGALCAGTSIASSARAEDLFEIAVFHAPIVSLHHLDLELHSNLAAIGPSSVPPGEVSTRGLLYELIEPSYGFAPGWEVGMHIQQALRADGVPLWGGERLRVMGMLAGDGPDAQWHLAVNVEGGYEPERFDPAQWGLEVRPVIEWTCEPLDVDLNPTLAVPLGGADPAVPELQPSVALRFLVADVVRPSVEYYAQLGPVSHPLPPALQRHYVFETVDVVHWPEWIVHLGVGEGLTSMSTGFIVTSLLGHHF